MKSSFVLLVTLLHIFVCLSLEVKGTSAREVNAQVEEFERKAPKYGVSEDSFEETGEEENGEDSLEYSQTGHPDINAYLFGRSLKKGFNAWAGKRELENQPWYKRAINLKRSLSQPSKNFLKIRQRRRPWGGSV